MNEEVKPLPKISKSTKTYSCPCKKWSNRNIVLLSPKSEEETKSFINWISSSSLCHIANESNQYDLGYTFHSKSNLKNPNFYRINAAFWILNEIRDACKRILSPSTSDLSSDALTLDETEKSIANAKDSYNSAFPSLPGTNLASSINGKNSPTTNILVGRKKPKPKQFQQPTVWKRASSNNNNKPINTASKNGVSVTSAVNIKVIFS